jgi:hypothetical protein
MRAHYRSGICPSLVRLMRLVLLWRRQLAPELLELRAQPQSVTRINRKVLIGGAAIVLLFISGITLVALKPPRLRISNPNELFNVEHKPIADALSRLPETYEGVKPDKNSSRRCIGLGSLRSARVSTVLDHRLCR